MARLEENESNVIERKALWLRKNLSERFGKLRLVLVVIGANLLFSSIWLIRAFVDQSFASIFDNLDIKLAWHLAISMLVYFKARR